MDQNREKAVSLEPAWGPSLSTPLGDTAARSCRPAFVQMQPTSGTTSLWGSRSH